jgi:hypothetical protein
MLLSVSFYDDDTGAPVNLAYITALSNPNGFTGNSWTITDGAISTTSATQFTIPGYPVGNQLSALSLVVGTGLAIAAGDPITITDTPTGKNTVVGYVTNYNSNTGALVVQVGFTFQFEIRRIGHRDQPGTGFGIGFDFGVLDETGPLLTASLGNGIFITDLGFILITIPEAQFKKLGASRTYSAALTCTDSVNTRQIFVAELPVLRGGVTN